MDPAADRDGERARARERPLTGRGAVLAAALGAAVPAAALALRAASPPPLAEWGVVPFVGCAAATAAAFATCAVGRIARLAAFLAVAGAAAPLAAAAALDGDRWESGAASLGAVLGAVAAGRGAALVAPGAPAGLAIALWFGAPWLLLEGARVVRPRAGPPPFLESLASLSPPVAAARAEAAALVPCLAGALLWLAAGLLAARRRGP